MTSELVNNEEDARDAARYRYLCAHWDAFTGFVSHNPRKWLDETIDKEMTEKNEAQRPK